MMLPCFGVPCRLFVLGGALDGVDFGVVVGDGLKGFFFGLGKVRLIEGEICKGPLSESGWSTE